MQINKPFSLLILLFLTYCSHAHALTLDKTIHQERSLYRNILVKEGGEYRCMTFGRFHGHQTCINNSAPQQLVLEYTRGLMSSLYIIPNPQKVLVIGLGGGVIPMSLRSLYPNLAIDVVELDPVVLNVAKDYFNFSEDALLNAYVDDGRVFVRKQLRAGISYDLIIIDAFDKDYIPEHLLTYEFLNQIKGILSPDGIIAANTFTEGALHQHEGATYQAVFNSVYNIDLSGGNRIIIAGNNALLMEKIEQHIQIMDSKLAAAGISSAIFLAGLNQMPVMNARVLTDQYSPSNLLLQYGSQR